MDSYQTAGEKAEQGKLEEAWKIIGPKLIANPNDPRALVTGAYVMRRFGALAQSYHFAKAACQLLPHDAAAWTNFGHTASEMWLVDEAERYYKRGLKVVTNEKHRKVLQLNLSALYLDNGRFAEAEAITREILRTDPAHMSAQANLGFCQLAKRDWNGWKGYHNTIGSDWRPKVQYRDEPEWDGSPGKVVALYADQGLGDEISFASMLPDAIEISRKVMLDCDARLANLFKRSFPKAKVYGTRRAKEGQWAPEDRQIDCSLPLGQIGEFFRTTDDSFPGVPYLVPCPDRMRMWKALFASKGKPAIGVAWTGGIPKTNSRNRQLSLEELKPLFEIDAHFVSLQYKDASKEIQDYPITQYAYGTLTQDYDDTAALVASLDYVVCIQTAVAHTAGALGVPVSVLIPTATQWRYGGSGDSVPWYRSLNVIRQTKTGSWSHEIECAVERVRDHLGRVSSRTGTSPQDDFLRNRFDRIRSASYADHQQIADLSSAGLRLRQSVQPGEASQGQA